MADTVKKSRIVSNPDSVENASEESSLQDIINEEFNQRLKHCMKDFQEEIETNKVSDSNVLNHSNEISSNGLSTNNETGDESWSQNGHTDEQAGDLESPEDDPVDSFVNNENLGPDTCQDMMDDTDGEVFPSSKERFLSTVTDFDEEEEESKCAASAKDRMFLSTDSACILFTQTVMQSPMLTPTEESYDFLQGITSQNSNTTSPEDNVTSYETQPAENQEVIDNKIIIEHQTELVDISNENDAANELELVNQCEINTAVIDKTPENVEKFIANIEDIKDATLRFLQTEIMELGKEISNFIPQIENTDIDTEQEIEIVDFNNDNNQTENVIKDSTDDISEVEIMHTTNDDINEEEIIHVAENYTDANKVAIIITSDVTENEDEVKFDPSDEEENKEVLPINDTPQEETMLENNVLDEGAIEDCGNNAETAVIINEEEILPGEQQEEEINVIVKFEEEIDRIMSENKEVIMCEESEPKGEMPSPTKVSEISKKFSGEDEETVQVVQPRPISPNLSGTFDTVQKTKEIFEKKSTTDVTLPKSCTMIKNLDDGRKKTDDMCDSNNFVCSNLNSSSKTTTESTIIETTTESKNNQDKSPLKKKKSKKTKKEHEKENISVKSSFSKFDALTKKTVLHVRSTEASKAQDKFNGSAPVDTSNCKSCSKPVFQMEQIKAEKSIWHKNCFRCNECNKQLNVDTYQSNEGVLYCKPHFKALFTPKAVEESNQPIKPRKHEMIIRENQPEELPPDVVRASDKPDLGLEELQNLNMKERFQVFEHHDESENNLERTPSAVNVKRSPSILSKLAKFQSKGMNIGVEDESLNGIPVEESSSESEPEEEDDGITGEDADLIRAKRAQREKPLHFNNMSDIMSKWESGNQMSKEERREERKQEIQSIRSRLFMGKQGKMKELYQQAVMDSESGAHVKKQVATEVCENAKLIKEKFERGEALTHDEEQKLTENEDMSVFDNGICKKSRSIFLELDANASKAPQLSPISPVRSSTDVRKVREAFMGRQASEDVVRSSDQVDDVTIQTADISNRFKFFEAYKEPEKKRKQFRITPPREGQVKTGSPEREIYRDPEVVRSEEYMDDSVAVQKSHTATKMLSIFRQMEENVNKEPQPAGPKPLKRFTPPPEPTRDESSSEGDESGSEEETEESEPEDISKLKDEDLLEAQKAARAKHLRAKFERWEANELQREQNNSSVNIAEELGQDQSQIESAKSLRARFESMREPTTEKERAPRVKVNRFV